MTPFGVDIIAIPNPLFTFGRLPALEKILLPGFETLSKALITGLPEWYFKSKDNIDLLSFESILSLELKYHSGNPVISNFERVSKPGRRIFSSANGLPKINNGLGIAIISTPKGVMTDIDARKQRVGGEIICKVF